MRCVAAANAADWLFGEDVAVIHLLFVVGRPLQLAYWSREVQSLRSPVQCGAVLLL